MENQKSHLRELEIFHEIPRAINASLSQQAVLESMLGHIVADLGYRAAMLRLLDQEKQTFKLKAFHGLSEMYLSKGDVELKKSGIDLTVISGQAVAIGDVRTESGFQYCKAAEQEGLTSMLAVPLTLKGKGIGVQHVYTAEPHEFSPDEKAFIEGIATLGAQAIRRTHCVEAIPAKAGGRTDGYW